MSACHSAATANLARVSAIQARRLHSHFTVAAAKADKCGVCNGTSNTCKSHEGLIKESTLVQGYNDLITLPAGATAIKIAENRPTSNSLGKRSRSLAVPCHSESG